MTSNAFTITKTSNNNYRITDWDYQVSTNTSFTSVVKSRTEITTSSATVTGLNPNTTYYIRIRGENEDGTGSYTSYKTQATPKADQTITFSELPVKTFGDADFAPGATASSGLPVSYASSNTSVATIVSGNIHIVEVGSSNITASQAGSSIYNAAPSVTRQLTVNGRPGLWTGEVSGSWQEGGNWHDGNVPDDEDDVVIPDATTTLNDPNVNAAYTVNSFTVEDGGVVNFTDSGSQIIADSGEISVTGTGEGGNGALVASGSNKIQLCAQSDDITLAGSKISAENGDIFLESTGGTISITGDTNITADQASISLVSGGGDIGGGGSLILEANGNMSVSNNINGLTGFNITNALQVDLQNVSVTTGDISVTGLNVDLNGTTYTSTGGFVTFTGPVDLDSATGAAVTSGGGSGDNISFTSTINGKDDNTQSVNLDAGAFGTISVSGAIGGSANKQIRTLTITNSNGATFSGAVTADTSVVLTDTADSAEIIFTGALVTPTLTTANRGYNLELNGNGSTVTNLVKFLNTGTLALGNDAGDTLTFNGGIETTGNASKPASTTLNGTLATSNDPVVLGATTISGTAVISSGGGAINFSGTTGGGGTLTATGGTATYDMAGDQTIFKGTYEGVSFAGGAFTKTLAGPVDISHTLTLTSGLVSLGDNDLKLGALANINGGSATSMIVTDGSGVLKKEFSGTGSFDFPVGSGTDNYSPATLDFTSGSFNSGWAGVKVAGVKQPQNTSSTDYLTRYWTVTSGGITGFSCKTSFTYLDADIEGTEASIYGASYNGSAWTVYSQVVTGTNTFSANGVSSFSDFTGVQQGAAPTTQASEITFSDVEETTMTVGWTRGSGNEVVVVAHAGSAVDSPPVDGTIYTANAAFGSGDKIGTENYVIYKGSGTSVSVTGLTSSTTYHFQAYELDDTGVPIKYNTATAANNPNCQKTDGATKVVLTGPATVLKDGLGAFTLTAKNSSDEVKNVNQDTTFNLSSNASTGTFYSDAVGTTPLPSSQVTIADGSSTATVYYRDDTFGTPTLTASVAGGMSLTAGTKQIGVKGNNALNFDGVNDYVTADGVCASLDNPTQFSMEAWINTADFTNQPYILAFNNADKSNNIQLGIQNDGTLKILRDNAVVSGSTVLTLNHWYHVALTLTSDNSAVLYLNGVSEITTTINERPAADGYFSIGQEWDGGASDFFNGVIDEVRVWNDVRTQTEIRAEIHRELQGNEAGLVGYYKMDTGTGTTTAYDSSSSGNDGTLTGDPTWQTSGAMSGPANALDFDGTDEHVTCGNINLNGSALTLEAWVNVGAFPGSANTISSIIGEESGGGSTALLRLGDDNLDNEKVQFVLDIDGELEQVKLDGITALNIDTWYHVAATYDGSDMHIYINGKEDAS